MTHAEIVARAVAALDGLWDTRRAASVLRDASVPVGDGDRAEDKQARETFRELRDQGVLVRVDSPGNTAVYRRTRLRIYAYGHRAPPGCSRRTNGVCGTGASLARLIPAYLPPHAFGQTTSGDLSLYPAGHSRSGTMGACLDCACALGAALPALAYDPDHHHLTRDGRLLLWWSPNTAEVLPAGRLLARPDPDVLESAPTQGHLCAMLLHPNTGRIRLSWFLDEPARTIADRIHAWYDAIGVYDGWTDTTHITGIPELHAQLGRWRPSTRTYQTPSVTAPESGLWTAALSGYAPRQYGRPPSPRSAATTGSARAAPRYSNSGPAQPSHPPNPPPRPNRQRRRHRRAEYRSVPPTRPTPGERCPGCWGCGIRRPTHPPGASLPPVVCAAGPPPRSCSRRSGPAAAPTPGARPSNGTGARRWTTPETPTP